MADVLILFLMLNLLFFNLFLKIFEFLNFTLDVFDFREVLAFVLLLGLFLLSIFLESFDLIF